MIALNDEFKLRYGHTKDHMTIQMSLYLHTFKELDPLNFKCVLKYRKVNS